MFVACRQERSYHSVLFFKQISWLAANQDSCCRLDNRTVIEKKASILISLSSVPSPSFLISKVNDTILLLRVAASGS